MCPEFGIARFLTHIIVYKLGLLANLKIYEIIAKADKEPGLLGIFGVTEDTINDWRNATKDRMGNRTLIYEI